MLGNLHTRQHVVFFFILQHCSTNCISRSPLANANVAKKKFVNCSPARYPDTMKNTVPEDITSSSGKTVIALVFFGTWCNVKSQLVKLVNSLDRISEFGWCLFWHRQGANDQKLANSVSEVTTIQHYISCIIIIKWKLSKYGSESMNDSAE